MMDEIKENEKDIINYIQNKTQLKENGIKIEYEKLLGFSNLNYIIVIKDILNGKILEKNTITENWVIFLWNMINNWKI